MAWPSMSPVARALVYGFPLTLLALAIIVVPLRMMDEQGLPRYRALSAELAEIRGENRRLLREVRDLERDVRALRTDPAAIERIARDELGMLRPGEILFQFPLATAP